MQGRINVLEGPCANLSRAHITNDKFALKYCYKLRKLIAISCFYIDKISKKLC